MRLFNTGGASKAPKGSKQAQAAAKAALKGVSSQFPDTLLVTMMVTC
jgi:hypothetical protein